MKALFSIVSLLIVLAVVGMVAKKQLQAQSQAARTVASPAMTGSPDVAATERPQQLPQRVQQDVERAMQQAADRAASGAEP